MRYREEPDEDDCGNGCGRGNSGMTLAERPEPEAAGNDVVVEVHASGFTPGKPPGQVGPIWRTHFRNLSCTCAIFGVRHEPTNISSPGESS
jgi:hypothetical protein